MKNLKWFTFVLAFSGCATLVVPSRAPAARQLSPEERYARTEAVLRHFGVPLEAEYLFELKSLDGVQSREKIQARLPFLDLTGAFSRYSQLSSGDPAKPSLEVFQDPDSRSLLDFSLALAVQPVPSSARYRQRLVEASRAGSLKGLRIVLDPGHMGGDVWDLRTEKYAKDKNGRKISEGVLNLQVALLLEKELAALGAEVFLTRRGLHPVSRLPYETFDLKPFALARLRESVQTPWFQRLLETAPAGEKLFSAFERSAQVKELFSESMRSTYFFVDEDLTARAKMIEQLDPDLALMIHFDTYDPPGQSCGINPKPYNATKAYVAGSFGASEFSSREDRYYFVHHLLTPDAWDDSVHLGQSIVSQFSAKLGIPLDKNGGNEFTKRVVPGIYSRNLILTRKTRTGVLSFLECMFYNNSSDFERLLKPEFSLEIEGKTYSYSSRHLQVVDAIREGVLDFVKNYPPR